MPHFYAKVERVCNVAAKLTPSNALQFSLTPVSRPKKSKSIDRCVFDPLPKSEHIPKSHVMRSQELVIAQANTDGNVSSQNYNFGLPLNSHDRIFIGFPANVSSSSLVSHTNCNEDKHTLPRAKQFTRRARQMVLDAGGALEKEGIPAEDFFFCTATLPGSTNAAMRALACYSRYAVNILKQFLRRRKLYLTINTWEWQKRGALHLHLIVVCNNPELTAKRVDPLTKNIESELAILLREKWLDILSYISEKTGVNMFARAAGGSHHRKSKAVLEKCVRTIQCEDKPGSSPVAYLAKYVGKGSQIPNKKMTHKLKKTNSLYYYPSSWWSVSDSVRTLIQKHTYIFSVRLHNEIGIEQFIDAIDAFSGVSKIILPVFSPAGYQNYLYCRLYLNSESFEESKVLLDNIFKALNSEYGIETNEAKMSIKLPTFNPLQWLRSPQNHKYKFDFCYNYLSSTDSYLATNTLFSDSLPQTQTNSLSEISKKAFTYIHQLFNKRVTGYDYSALTKTEFDVDKPKQQYLALSELVNNWQQLNTAFI